MNNIQEKLDTVNKLPQKPYCSFTKSRSFIYPKEIALNLPYIQYNTPISKPFMLFDIDNNKEPFEWLDNTKKPIPPITIRTITITLSMAWLEYDVKDE